MSSTLTWLTEVPNYVLPRQGDQLVLLPCGLTVRLQWCGLENTCASSGLMWPFPVYLLPLWPSRKFPRVSSPGIASPMCLQPWCGL